ncbi:MAG: hypothetical protein ACXVUL_08880 [Solirubrobacteraceae bacterium]
MSLPRRRRPADAPDWAAPLGGAQFTEFCEHLQEALAPHGAYEMGECFVTVAGRPTRYGLTNLLQAWALSEPAQRADLVALHFRNLFEAEDTAAPTPAQLTRLIRPRVRSRDQTGAVGLPSLSQTVAEGVDAVLCVDLPTAVSNLKPEEAAATGRTMPELWELAISQIDDGEPVQEDDLGNGVTAFFGDSFFVASRVLDLEHFAGEMPTQGALVAMPHGHLFLIHTIETTRTLNALNAMVAAADHFYRRGPGSIVPHVFWWRHDHALLRIPAGIRDGHHYIVPPDEFVVVLNELPAASDG